jgi:hypothetical protein
MWYVLYKYFRIYDNNTIVPATYLLYYHHQYNHQQPLFLSLPRHSTTKHLIKLRCACACACTCNCNCNCKGTPREGPADRQRHHLLLFFSLSLCHSALVAFSIHTGSGLCRKWDGMAARNIIVPSQYNHMDIPLTRPSGIQEQMTPNALLLFLYRTRYLRHSRPYRR